ncbi:MAG: phosphoribosylglycinamide formyltransferase [Siphonobacter sp.]
MKRLALFASGSGTNVENIVQYFRHHDQISVELILCNNPQAGVIARAERLGIPLKLFNREQFRSGEVLDWLQQAQIDWIILAGFLWLVPHSLVAAYPNRILNIHPALLPKYGGKGMYGLRVHEAVVKAGERESGITIHLVNEHYDEGNIIFQDAFTVEPTDTPEQVAHKCHQLEYQHFPGVIEKAVLEQA